MRTFRLTKDDTIEKAIDGEIEFLVKKEKWEEFNSKLLGIGDLSEKSTIISAISAIFDLEGFTHYCKQIDPHLSVPIFLSKFLGWFFQKIKDETKNTEHTEGIETWHDLPIFMKFLGDGILVIWDTEKISQTGQANIIISCNDICDSYIKEFYPTIKKKVSDAPKKLRCGIAKGNILTVGNGEDFVGPCINFASRLQNLPGVSFSFSDRGFNVEEHWKKENVEDWVVKKIKVKGIGDAELVYILKSDYEKMSIEDKKIYLEP